MVFSSVEFLFLFLPIVILVYYLPIFKGITFKNIFLLFSSILFYAWGEPVFVVLMLFSILLTWAVGLLMEKNAAHSKGFLIAAITYHILVLFIFKYLAFVLQQMGLLFFHKELELGIELPIGISFFTFQMMSYLFDLYYKKARAQKNIFNLALYVSLFPQLIAGPIVRYSHIEKEITLRKVTGSDFAEGMERFIYGLAKKVLLSNYLAYIADMIFNAGSRSVATAWLGALCYTLQIYFDFSGYSDMAVGIGRIFGFHFPENFDYPYISRSVTEFWRRWHISLSGWFRDYVYIPMGGNRVSKKRWFFNIFVVWLLTGIWHGANWTYMAWGILYFIVLVIEKNIKIKRMGVLSHVYTLIVVVFAWVIFRSSSIESGVAYIGNMVGINSVSVVDEMFHKMAGMGIFVIPVGCILSTPIYREILRYLGGKSAVAEKILRSVICIVLFILSVVETVAATYNPFIYFNF